MDIVLVVDKASKLEGVEIAEEDIFLLVVLMVELVSVELIVVVIKMFMNMRRTNKKLNSK